jgi:cytochrome c1
LHLGRELFLEFRCAKCHAGPSAANGVPELATDAPSFEGIGSRRNYDWMARWIGDPKALRSMARMPRVLRGENTKQEAESIAAYLASLKSGMPKAAAAPDKDQVNSGKALFETLHCDACHDTPGQAGNDPEKISLKHALQKFFPGTLAEFLQKPDAHYVWTRMPDFKLSADESAQLAAYLVSAGDAPSGIPAAADPAAQERGRKLVQTSGCLNCHGLKLQNQFSARPLADMKADEWKRGCLAATPADAGRAPLFAFADAEREALQAFGAGDRASLTRPVPSEFAERQTRLLNCRECHGKVEGLPVFDLFGEKLRPEWAAGFISGAITNKPRPWLEARMPAFGRRPDLLAQGLAMQHGYPPHTPAEPPVDMEKARVGQKLVSMAGGLSCVTCHGVGTAAPPQLFESAGVNFALTASRILKSFAQRWIRNPQLIDPSTKMPLYFDEQGKSPLTDIYGGDGAKQIDAMWEYFRLGDKMPPPPTP